MKDGTFHLSHRLSIVMIINVGDNFDERLIRNLFNKKKIERGFRGGSGHAFITK